MQLSRVVVLVAAVGAAVGLWQWWNSVDIKNYYAGKRVIITGASRGIGRSMALQLAQLGAKLVISARGIERLTETAKECQQYSSDVQMVVGDMGRGEDCSRLVQAAVDALGGVDILIINAAYTHGPAWFSKDENLIEHFHSSFRVNVMQSVHLVRSALSHLNASQGSIIVISSGSGIVGIPKYTDYTTSKHALQGFFKALNQEFIMSNTPVSITIMPLPFVLTEVAVANWNPVGDGQGLTPDDCAVRVIKGIPRKQLWYCVDWTTFFTLHLYSLWPEFFDMFTRMLVYQTSYAYSDTQHVV